VTAIMLLVNILDMVEEERRVSRVAQGARAAVDL
jgi:hypothetical protein